MLLRQKKNKNKRIKLFKAAGEYQVGASLTASRCYQANQNAFSYFGLIRNINSIDILKAFTICVTYYSINNTTFNHKNHLSFQEFYIFLARTWHPHLNLTMFVPLWTWSCGSELLQKINALVLYMWCSMFASYMYFKDLQEWLCCISSAVNN